VIAALDAGVPECTNCLVELQVLALQILESMLPEEGQRESTLVNTKRNRWYVSLPWGREEMEIQATVESSHATSD
jgi:hypothetical protein